MNRREHANRMALKKIAAGKHHLENATTFMMMAEVPLPGIMAMDALLQALTVVEALIKHRPLIKKASDG